MSQATGPSERQAKGLKKKRKKKKASSSRRNQAKGKAKQRKMSSDGFRERKRDAGTDPDATDAAHSSPRVGLLTGGSAASATGTTAASGLLPRHWRVLDVVTWTLLLAVLLVLVLIFTPMGDSTAAAGRRALAQMTSDDPQTRAKVLRWVQEKGLPLEPCSAALTDHIPCHDPRVAAAFPRARNAYRERHCPESGTAGAGQACLVPPPRGYRAPVRWPASLHEVWRANVPEGAKVAERKGRQGWVREEGEKWVFPGGGTMFAGEGGAGKYIQRLARWIPALDAAAGGGDGDRGGGGDEDGGVGGGGDEDGGNGEEDNGDGGGDSSSSGSSSAHRGTVRTALDIGCGVASFGGYLLRRNVLTLSLAPRDSHKAQVQLALERGIPALVSALGTQRLPVPSRAFDLVHCSRCLVDFADRNGTSLLEVDRVLRPGGFFVLSGPPVRWPGRDAEWAEVQALARGMCYTLLPPDAGGGASDSTTSTSTTAVFRKAAARELLPRGRCYAGRGKPYPPRCAKADDPDAAWYVPLQACVTRLPDSDSAADSHLLPPWPQRLYEPPRRLSKPSSESLEADFRADTRRWKSRIARYEHLLGGTFQDLGIRNILDMNAHYGGFAAGLAAQHVWVMNVVPVGADTLPDTLPVIVDRGLIGVYHHWCEPFSTYPRTYDLVHVVNLRVFTTELTNGRRCSLVEVLLELDRVLRPRGTVIFRDGPKMLDNIARLARAVRWDAQIYDPEAGAVGGNKKLLVAKKRFWTLEDDQ